MKKGQISDQVVKAFTLVIAILIGIGFIAVLLFVSKTKMPTASVKGSYATYDKEGVVNYVECPENPQELECELYESEFDCDRNPCGVADVCEFADNKCVSSFY